jgi:hypothetical protein
MDLTYDFGPNCPISHFGFPDYTSDDILTPEIFQCPSGSGR